MNSYFATVEQQANPRLRGKPIGVTGGDRMERTVVGAASIEAKKFGVRTGMAIWQAKQLCPEIILVRGDSDKYLETTKRFLNILKDYSPYLEVFSIDEVFLEFKNTSVGNPAHLLANASVLRPSLAASDTVRLTSDSRARCVWGQPPSASLPTDILGMALDIKRRIREEVGDYIKCSIGISYNKIMAKLAGSLYKPDGLVVIADEQAAQFILDKIELNEICGIGFRIKKRLNNMGIFSFSTLRKIPLKVLLASFKSYGQILYNMSRGIDYSLVTPFYEKMEVKSIGHRHTIDHDTSDLNEIKQILLKLTELIARKLRAKKLVGKTVNCWYRVGIVGHLGFSGNGMQMTIPPTNDGLEIFKAGWKVFQTIWDHEKIRMIGVSVSNLQPNRPQNLSLLPENTRQETIIQAIDKINDKFGEFTIQRGILLGSSGVKRKPNPFLSDRRFKLYTL